MADETTGSEFTAATVRVPFEADMTKFSAALKEIEDRIDALPARMATAMEKVSALMPKEEKQEQPRERQPGQVPTLTASPEAVQAINNNETRRQIDELIGVVSDIKLQLEAMANGG